MANTLKIKRGSNATVPQGQLAEPLFTTDTYDLYIGKGGALGNQRFQKYIASGTSSQFLKGDGSLDSTTYQATSEKGQNNGYASLDSGGKIPAAQLPSTVIEYKGTWNASTNTPTLADGTGDAGDVYIVSVGGTQNLGSGSITFDAGDWVMYNGSIWQKSTGSNAVASVNGQTGIVVLDTDDISEPVSATNLWFTNARARTAISITTTGSSGMATYDNMTGVLNVPNYSISGLGGVPTSRQLTINGTAYDLSADRSWSVGTVTSVAALTIGTTGTDITSSVANGTTTPVITLNIPTASATNRGALSSMDWSTFNGKQAQLNGTGFVKASGTTISYDNNTYLTTSSASSTYVPYSGATTNVNLGVYGLTAGVNLIANYNDQTPGASASRDVIQATTSFTPSGSGNAKTDWKNFNSSFTINTTGTLTNYFGYYATAPTVTSGTITNKYSFYGAFGAGIGYFADGMTLTGALSGTSASFTAATANFTLGSQSGTAIYAHFGSKSASGGQAIAMRLGGTLTATANFDNLFGLYVDYTDDAAGYSGVTRYGIYQNDSGKRNYFGGITTFNSAINGSDTITGTAFIPTGSSIPSRGMYTSASNVLDFSAASTNLLSINYNTGLSTFSTGVRGNYFRIVNVSTAEFGINSENSQGYIGTTNSYSFNIMTNNTSRLTVAHTTGNVTLTGALIGTSATFNTSIIIGNVSSLTGAWGNLTSVLQLGNSNTDKGYISVNEISGDDDINIVRYAYFDNTNWKRIGGGNPSRYSQRNAEHIFQYASSGADNSTITWNTALTLTNGGNVGIGTTDPKLNGNSGTFTTIYNASAGGWLELATGSTTDGIGGSITFNNTNIVGTDKRNAQIVGAREGANNSAYLAFATWSAGTGAERMRITSGGLVGIGNTNPGDYNANAYSLVVGTTTGSNGITIASGNLSTGSLYFADGTTGNSEYRGYIEYQHGLDDLVLGTSAIGRFTISGAGFYYLTNILAASTANAANMYVNTTSGLIAYSTSSRKYKHDIRPYDKGINDLMKMNPVYYKGINDGDMQFAGLIAEEIDQLGMKEYVEYLNNEPNALRYSNMVTILVKAIQELKLELDTIKNK